MIQKAVITWKKYVENVEVVSDDEFQCENTYF